MTLQQIQVLCAVAELKSMTLAAEQLHMTQPGVSRMISMIEKEAGVQFFFREGRNLSITPEGRRCYQDAIKVLQAMAAMDANLGKEKPQAYLHVGCTAGLGPLVFIEVRRRFLERFPSCRLVITEGRTNSILEMVNKKEYRMGFIQGQISDTNLQRFQFCRDSLKVVARPDYQLRSRKKMLSIFDLAQEDIILIAKGSGIRKQIDSFANSYGLTLEPVWECYSGENAVEVATQGIGLAILSNITVDAHIRAGRLVEFPTNFKIKRDYDIFWRKDHCFTKEEQCFMKLCQEEGAKASC